MRPDPMATPSRSFVVSLDNRKPRGAGHERRREILIAARELFLEQGTENVTTRQIASKVGISQTALYAHFKKKHERLDALVDEAFGKLAGSLAALQADLGSPASYLQAAIPCYIRFGIDNPDEYRLAFRMGDGRQKSAEIAEARREAPGFAVFAALESHVAAGLKAGSLRSSGASPRALAQSIWAAIHGLVALLLAYRDFDWVPLDELINVHANMLMHGLFTDPPQQASS